MTMQILFTKTLSMSLTASVVVIFALAARMVFRRIPKIFSYALWFVVLFRLLCPIAVSSPLSLFQIIKPTVSHNGNSVLSDSKQGVNFILFQDSQDRVEYDWSNQTLRADRYKDQEKSGAAPLKKWTLSKCLAVGWLIGGCAMILLGVISFVRLKYRLIGATPLRRRVYLSDYVSSPFVFGVLKPRIYLPSALSEKEQEYVLLHEQTHIKRGDHIYKMLFFLALTIHWFNPFVWLSFMLFEKDMEMSCDEAVMRHMQQDIRAAYCASLIRLSNAKHYMPGTLLTFGESNVKSRVKNIMRYKKPILIVSVVAAALIIVFAVALGSSPVSVLSNKDKNQSNLASGQRTDSPAANETSGSMVSAAPQSRDLNEIKQHLAGFSNDSQELINAPAYVLAYNGQYNKQYLEEFLQQTENKRPATLDIISFTVEGDAIIQHIDYNGQDYFVVDDYSRDHFSVGASEDKYEASTWQILSKIDGIKENGDQYSYLFLLKDDTITEEQIENYIRGNTLPESIVHSIKLIASVVTGNVNAELSGDENWHELSTSFDEREILRSRKEIYKIEIVNNATGGKVACFAIESNQMFRELLQTYEKLDIVPDDQLEYRQGASYTMNLYDGTEKNLLQTVVPYKDAVKINGEMYDGSMNGTTTQLLMKLEQFFKQGSQ